MKPILWGLAFGFILSEVIGLSIHSYNDYVRTSVVLAAPIGPLPIERTETGMKLPTLGMDSAEGVKIMNDDIKELDHRLSVLEKKEMLRNGR